MSGISWTSLGGVGGRTESESNLDDTMAMQLTAVKDKSKRRHWHCWTGKRGLQAGRESEGERL
jgi:hypothetical protein